MFYADQYIMNNSHGLLTHFKYIQNISVTYYLICAKYVPHVTPTNDNVPAETCTNHNALQ